MTAAEQTAITEAITRGQQLYAFDQAAWHATDRMMDDAKAQGRLDTIRNSVAAWVVRELDDSLLEVVFYDHTADAPKAVYVVRLSEGGKQVVSGEFAAPDSPITDAVTLRLISAQRAALASLERTSIPRCKPQSYNIAVLPPRQPDGPVPVYILTPQTDMAHVPFGGHVRIVVAADGTLTPPHAFAKSCLELVTNDKGAIPQAIVVSQLMDPLPTEISVFTMLAARVPLLVITMDYRRWGISAPNGRARISLLPAK